MTKTPEEIMARAIATEVADGDDIDIFESLTNNFDWIDEDQAEKMISAASQAAIKALVDEGYVIVPREPTDEMIDSGCSQMAPFDAPVTYRVYQSMIAAITTAQGEGE